MLQKVKTASGDTVLFYVKGGPGELRRAEQVLQRRKIRAAVKRDEYLGWPQVQVPLEESSRAESVLKKARIDLAGGPYRVPSTPDSVISVGQARAGFAHILSEVAYRGERVLITRHGKPVAAIVPPADMELLDEMEDRSDLEAARRARQEARRKGTIPLSTVLREFR